MASHATMQRLVQLGLLLLALSATPAVALPEIRTHEANRVPACVTPARLMHFMAGRNPNMEPRLRDIARLYRQHGEALRVRWDYAFFQMLLETNYLTYRTGSGRWGDVKPSQNNFAGIGTTGGGVPGDSFPDVSTGVLAQFQHLVAYSGEHVANPFARRTRERQDDIIEVSRKLNRPVTFRDLTRRWAVDRQYGQSIEAIAERYRSAYCTGQVIAGLPEEDDRRTRPQAAPARAARAAPEQRNTELAFNTTAMAGAGPALLRQPRPVERAAACKVWTASYGGTKNVLIRTHVGEEIHYTALQVLDGFERSLSDTFIRVHARGGEPIEEFENREAALARAFDLCPSARHPQ
jgi:Mannosyl-glycoprotein endo-beta-N-acetylglucosaminidase